jgi:hypothetical protein
MDRRFGDLELQLEVLWNTFSYIRKTYNPRSTGPLQLRPSLKDSSTSVKWDTIVVGTFGTPRRAHQDVTTGGEPTNNIQGRTEVDESTQCEHFSGIAEHTSPCIKLTSCSGLSMFRFGGTADDENYGRKEIGRCRCAVVVE